MRLNAELYFDVAKQQLLVKDEEQPIALTFAETQILATLCNRQQQIVSKEELIASAWPDRVVGDSSLQNALSTLRRKLAPFSDIELKTLPRRGYALYLPQPESGRPFKLAHFAVAFALLAILAVGLQLGLERTQKQHFLEQVLPSNLSGASGPMRVLRERSMPIDVIGLQQRIDSQFVPEPSWHPPFDSYQGFGLLTSSSDSFAFCPNYRDGQCPGDKLISIFGETKNGGKQELSEFLATKIRMEEKTYNRLQFDGLGDAPSQMAEQLYFGDAYFKLNEHQLARADMRISLVATENRSGLFYFAACVTDEDCYSTPLKYRIHGRYVKTEEHWEQGRVSRFTVSVDSVELSSPNRLSEMAKHLYREFRRSELSRDELVFYRIYQDEKTAVWILPFANKTLVWTQSRLLHL